MEQSRIPSSALYSDRRVREILEKIQAVSEEILAENLRGIYVHGSLAFGCFLWEKSDIDLLLVTETAPAQAEKERLLKALLDINELCPPKGLELSLVLERFLRPFCYPTPFELHYSNLHKKSCEEDLKRYCDRMKRTDKDLAAHVTVIRKVGIPLCGRSVEQMFDEVPREAYLDSLYEDIDSAAEEIIENPVYMICNLCRVLAYVKDGLVLSKAEGIHWMKRQVNQSEKEMLSAEELSFLAEAAQSYQDGRPFLTKGRESELKKLAEKFLEVLDRR